MSIINDWLRKKYNRECRNRLKNFDFSLICDNCIGGAMLHDLGLRFNSPFVNLWIEPSDYIKLLKNLDYYIQIREDLTFIHDETYRYPVGILGDVKIFFTHYSSENEAYKKWNERCLRINRSNLFVIFTERNGCTQKNLEEFDSLPFTHKIAFTHTPHPELVNAAYIRGFERQNELGIVLEYKNRFTGKKYFDDFDYVSWFNSEAADE